MAFKHKKEVPTYKQWLKTFTIPKRTDNQKKKIENNFNRKVKKLFDFYKNLSTEQYLMFLKWKEVQVKKNNTGFTQRDINYVKSLIWKPSDSKNYRGDFRRIYPELILCGNEFEINGKDVFNKSITLNYSDSDNLLKHWRILRLIVSKARDEGTVGRQFRYLVRDRDTKKYLGIICISSDMVDTSQRNKEIGLPKNFRKLNSLGLGLNVSANGQTIVPTQPFGKYFLGGKLLSLLCISKEVCSQWEKIYGDKLIGVTTTSLYGNKNNRLTQYDGLEPYWKNCGESTGQTPFKFTDKLEKEYKLMMKEHYPDEYYRHYVNRMREGKKRSYQWWLKKSGFTLSSDQPRGVYYSRIYLESDEYFRNIVKTFEQVCMKEKVYKISKIKKEQKGQIIISKEELTDELKSKLWSNTLQELKKSKLHNKQLTPKFDNSIDAITNFWKFGKKGDTTKIPVSVSQDTIKRRGKLNLQKDLGMVKGQVDTNTEKYKNPIQLSGKGVDTYEGLDNLTWEQIKEQYL